jgi:hypothetical protein
MILWFFIFLSSDHSGPFLGTHFGGVEVKMSDSSKDEEIVSQSPWISVSLVSVMQLRNVFFFLVLSLE